MSVQGVDITLLTIDERLASRLSNLVMLAFGFIRVSFKALPKVGEEAEKHAFGINLLHVYFCVRSKAYRNSGAGNEQTQP